MLLIQTRNQVSSFVPGNGLINKWFESVYVIHYSVDGKEAVSAILSDLDIVPEYVKATDHMTLDRKTLIDDQFITEECMQSMRSIASNLSHLAALNKFLETDANIAFILGDFIDVPKDNLAALKTKIGAVMSNVPNDWDIINFGRCMDKCNKATVVNEFVQKSSNALCRCAYAVTRAAAESIVQFTDTLNGMASGDQIISGYANAGKLQMYVPTNALFVENVEPKRSECN
eukprot:gene19544-26226_t